ncbi:MAG: gamma-glutamyltransferase, partial [Solobacterium sp.]|nr:gamma-glutamyltransferase [Solobacterium sp.]
MKFDPLYQPYSSNRYCITAKNGVVATGSGLAASAGLSVLRRGGNAVDAAVACAAALTVVEPTANGLGSDAFALVWMKDRLYGLNASGPSPYGISLEDVRRRSPEGRMPVYGWVPVTVPGAVGGWAALVERFGKLTLAEDLALSIEYAEQGYPLSAELTTMTQELAEKFSSEPYK